MNNYRTVKTYTMLLEGKPSQIFHLLCPVKEYDWIEPWEAEMVFTKSGVAELDAVFKTNFPDDGPEDVWLISRYEPNERIEFVRVNQLRTIRYTISLVETSEGRTESIWSQVFTALNPDGEFLIRSITDGDFRREMSLLEKMLNTYLLTGEMLRLE